MVKSNRVAVAVALVSLVAVGGSPSESFAGTSAGDQEFSVGSTSGHTLSVARPDARAAVTPRVSTGTRLGLRSTSDVLADPRHKHVFVSGGDASSGVVVTDSSGKLLKHLPSTAGARGMTLSPNGKTVYVALADGDGIREINASSLKGTTVRTGASTCPQGVAVTAGLVWFSYGCDGAGGAVGTLDPRSGAVHKQVLTGFDRPPLMASAGGLKRALFISDPGAWHAHVIRYHVTGGASPSAVLVASRRTGDNVQDMVETPNGKRLIVASYSVPYHQVYRTSTLAHAGSLKSAAFPVAVAVNEQGDVAAGVSAGFSKSVWIYRSRAAKAFKTIKFADSEYLQPHALAFVGSTVYAVTGGDRGSRLLHVISTLPAAPMRITTNRRHYRYGERVRVSAHVEMAGSPRVSLYATPKGGKTRLLRSGRATGGTISATYSVTRQTVFTASYDGGPTYAPTSKSRMVQVHAKVTSKPIGAYGHQGRYALFHQDKNPTWLITVAPNKSGSWVDVEAQLSSGGGWHEIRGSGKLVVLDRKSQVKGVLRGNHKAGQLARVRGIWGPDAANLKQVGAWSYVRFTS